MSRTLTLGKLSNYIGKVDRDEKRTESHFVAVDRDLQNIYQLFKDLYSGGSISNTTGTNTDYTALSTDHVLFLDTDGGDIILALPTSVEGRNYKIINCGTSNNDVTVSSTAGATLFGDTTAILTDGEVIDIHFNESKGWY